jgi:nucleoside-diphosphate-sugar epimerase
VNTVLVTGGSGFIGKAVRSEIESRGDKAISFDHPSTILDANQLRAMIVALGATSIINLAGVLGTAETIGMERRAAEVNILGALTVFDVAAEFGIPLVQVATGHEGQPNPYAITKRCATDLALARAQWTGQEINVVRAFHVYGPGQKLFPPHGASTVRKIIPSFVARALTSMPIEINGDGSQQIDLVWIGDVATVLVDALAGPFGRLVEAGTGRPTTVLEAAQDVISMVGSPSQIVHQPMRAGEPEGTTVVAVSPQCPNVWPYKLDETIIGYRGQVLA